jgi:iron complex transport system ATP-binding protein
MGTINAAIETRNLSFGFNGRQVLTDVSVEFPESRFSIVLGRNGSGKSTLLRILAGLLPHCKGEILVHGTSLHRFSNRERAGRIGFLGQKHKSVFPFSVEEVILTGRAAHVRYVPGCKDREAARKALHQAGIFHLRDRIYTELSGGEQQLVMIARLLAQEPQILLLDEPVSHLDYSNQIKIISLIKQLVKDGLTVIAVMHDPNLAFMFGEHFFFVNDSKVYTVEGKEPWKDPLVHDVFYEHLTFIPHGDKVVFIPSIQ